MIRAAAKLKDKKYRTQTGLFLVEGIKLVQEVLDSEWEVEHIFITADTSLKFDLNSLLRLKPLIKISEVSREILGKLSDVQTAQGVVATVKQKHFSGDDIPLNSRSVLILENIQDPGNMGTLIRSAVATGIDAVICAGDCVDSYAPKVLRSTMGGVFRIPIIKYSIADTWHYLNTHNFKTFAASLHDAADLYTTDLSAPAAIWLGNEAHGLSADTLAACEQKIYIPQVGNIESLNVAVAGAVIMYERLRQTRRTN